MSVVLLTDLYELTIAQRFVEHDKTDSAALVLFPRRLPKERNFLVSCDKLNAIPEPKKIIQNKQLIPIEGSLTEIKVLETLLFDCVARPTQVRVVGRVFDDTDRNQQSAHRCFR